MDELRVVTLGIVVFFVFVLPRIPPIRRRIEARRAAMTDEELREEKRSEVRSGRGHLRFMAALTMVAGVVVCFAGEVALGIGLMVFVGIALLFSERATKRKLDDLEPLPPSEPRRPDSVGWKRLDDEG